MTRARRVAAGAITLLIAGAGCGGSSGNLPPRPIETLIYVTGGANTKFMFAETPDLAACGGTGIPPVAGTGIQSPNASHQFGNQVFSTPYLFVLENIRQPVRAVIQNLDQTLPLQVSVFLGTNQRVGGGEGVINPGECRTISTQKNLSFTPMPSGSEVQVNVCAPQDTSVTPPRSDLSIACNDPRLLDPASGLSNRNLSYFATLGDIKVTNITNCILSPILDACTTPTSFFIEQPKDQVDAIMSLNPGQNPGDPQPPAGLRLELFVNGQNVANNFGGNPTVSANL